MPPTQVHERKRQCRTCRKPFVQYYGHYLQKQCPQCKGLKNSRVPVARRLLQLIPAVRIDSLPGQWEKFHTGNPRHFPSWKMEILGRDLKGLGSGRIVIRSLEPRRAGDLVQLRFMESVKIRHKSRIVDHYVALDPIEDDKDLNHVPLLKWSVVECPLRRGRVEVEDFSLWASRISCEDYEHGIRRIGVLAVVDEDNPVIVSTQGGDKELLLMT